MKPRVLCTVLGLSAILAGLIVPAASASAASVSAEVHDGYSVMATERSMRCARAASAAGWTLLLIRSVIGSPVGAQRPMRLAASA